MYCSMISYIHRIQVGIQDGGELLSALVYLHDTGKNRSLFSLFTSFERIFDLLR